MLWSRRLLFVFALSLLIHSGTYFVLTTIPTWYPKYESEPLEIEIVEVDETRLKAKGRVVRHAEPPLEQLKEELKVAADLLSLKTQRVLKQMQARRSGKTKNRAGNDESKVARPEPRRQNFKAFEPDFVTEAPDLNVMPSGASTLGDYLPKQIEMGSYTALNTNRFTFYSFFARVEDLFRFRWDTHLRAAADQLAGKSLKGMRRDTWITRLKIILDEKGEYKRSVLLKSSGIKLFDQAAIKAFADAKFFPNPPRGMVKGGQINLIYEFHVKWQPYLWSGS